MIEYIIGAVLVAGGLLGSGKSKQKISSPSPSQVEDFASQVVKWRADWEPMVDRSRWIPKSMVSRIVTKVPPPKRASASIIARTSDRLVEQLTAEFDTHNAAFLDRQKTQLKSFFDSVEKKPLTPDQVNACICMDDAVQIIAAAGSGKTSTMVARVGYALHQNLAQPKEILVLAFNRAVAEELQARIDTRLKDFDRVSDVTVKTFNAFGLSVIGKATGRKPSLAEWAEPGRDTAKLVEIIEGLRTTDHGFRRDWDLFRTVFGRDIGQSDQPSVANTFRNGQRGILTANGELVKSDEERMIADWLFFNGVRYEYERPYEHDTATEAYGQYKPDFYYPDIAVYHEHFALDKNGRPPAHFGGDYLGGVRWKRELHAEKNTQLFETTSYGIRSDTGFANLEAELARRGIVLAYDPERETKGEKPVTTEQLARTLRVFQQHVKSNGLSFQHLRGAVAKDTNDHRGRFSRFLALYERVASEWDDLLRKANCIDFDDMLLLATDHIESGRYTSPYLMVLADEFQDTSRAKVRMLKALLRSAGDKANLCVVGDDWQGINRFAGADIAVMTEFNQVFDHSTQLMLDTTFRCPEQVCELSSAFVQANPRQIRKTVRTTNPYTKKALQIFAAETQSLAMARLEEDLLSIREHASHGQLSPDVGDRINVMLLGRYNKDEPGELRRWRQIFGNHLNLEYRTIHSSKGLEADYVMLVNVVEGMMGFPSQINDDPVLQIAMPEPDAYPFAEERRLFYVALTRARRQVRIYTQTGFTSRFVIELARTGSVEIVTEGGKLHPCPKCGIGTMKRIAGKNGAFEMCSAHLRCDFKRNLPTEAENTKPNADRVRITRPIAPGATCPTCGSGRMVVRNSGPNMPFLACSGYPSCKTTAALVPFRKK